jgi:hypothetical protein
MKGIRTIMKIGSTQQERRVLPPHEPQEDVTKKKPKGPIAAADEHQERLQLRDI